LQLVSPLNPVKPITRGKVAQIGNSPNAVVNFTSQQLLPQKRTEHGANQEEYQEPKDKTHKWSEYE
jgi:hypothetical protein